MKNLSLVVLALTLFSCELHSQIQIFGRYTNGSVGSDINIFGTKKINEQVKLTYFALVEEKWSEALIGVAYAPEEYIELGVSGGLEHNPALYRFGTSLWLGNGKTSLLILAEKGDGAKNFWYKATASYGVSKSLALGARIWRFHGIGPVVNLEIKPLDAALWIMPAYDLESYAKRVMVGVDIKL